MPDRPAEPDRHDSPDRHGSSSADEGNEVGEVDQPDDADELRRQDSEAPALGAIEDGDQMDDLPEPQEPG